MASFFLDTLVFVVVAIPVEKVFPAAVLKAEGQLGRYQICQKMYVRKNKVYGLQLLLGSQANTTTDPAASTLGGCRTRRERRN